MLMIKAFLWRLGGGGTRTPESILHKIVGFCLSFA